MIPQARNYIAAGIALAWAGSLIGVGCWQNDAGHTDERVAWQEKDNAELRTANAEIQRLNDSARARERQNANDMAAISKRLQEETKNGKDLRDRDIAGAHNGSLVLRYNAPGLKAGGSATCTTEPSTGRRDGGTPTELPREVSANLFALVDDADEVVRQLTACQAVIRADRTLCNPTKE